MSNQENVEINVTLASTLNGQSDTISVHATGTTLKDLADWANALLGLDGQELQLFKDGKALRSPPSFNLTQAGIVHGDLIAVQAKRAAPPAPAPPAASGGLDFSALLNSGGATATASRQQQQQQPSRGVPPPSYYPGMHLDDAMELNPHPQNFCSLLFQHEHLWKELNYHSPTIAQKIRATNNNLEAATALWREELVKGSIRAAHAKTQAYQKHQQMTNRLQQNPNDAEAKEFFESENNQKLVQAQYQQAMQEYPESMGRVLMLYIQAKVNSVAIQAFVDSGAQNTIMSKKCAERCGVSHLIDTRFEGTAVGVGTGKILGRIHIVSLQIGDTHHFPCSVTVMDDSQGLGDKNMDFLLGLDMLKRHLCKIDVAKGCVEFHLPHGPLLEAPFLHEKDLDETKGGTKGFNADKANQELEDLRKKSDMDEK